VDSHVHIAEKAFMGAICADNFETGTLSAICGGTTTILSFAKQVREEKERSLVDVIDEYHGEAKGNSYCDYGFHLIITGTPAGSTN
jgi:dihydropyrimidinase